MRCSVRGHHGVPEAPGGGAHPGRQEHRSGQGPDADRLPAGAAAAEGRESGVVRQRQMLLLVLNVFQSK